jgi:DNA-directed RNA polymerase subunit F
MNCEQAAVITLSNKLLDEENLTVERAFEILTKIPHLRVIQAMVILRNQFNWSHAEVFKQFRLHGLID